MDYGITYMIYRISMLSRQNFGNVYIFEHFWYNPEVYMVSENVNEVRYSMLFKDYF